MNTPVEDMSLLRLIVASLVFVFAVVANHWLGLFLIRRRLDYRRRRWYGRGVWAIEVSFGITILSLIALHFIDIALAALIVLAHVPEQGLREAFLFAFGSFTTIGATPPDAAVHWRFLGPLIAMCGIFTFGWTTSFLVECSRLRRDAAEDRYRQAGGSSKPPPRLG